MKFAEHYNIDLPQNDLGFINIPLDTDIRLYVDPFSLALGTDPFCKSCTEAVTRFFELALEHVRGGHDAAALGLLRELHEPNDVHLGLSTGIPRGRGIGRDQATAVFARLRESRAVQTGFLQDLSDCELLIPGIGPDKISDITINTIRSELITYTQAQCRAYGVPMCPTDSGPVWDPARGNWHRTQTELPVYRGHRILLVPKHVVRGRLVLNHSTYYNHYMLTFLQEEYWRHPAVGLVQVVKIGERRRPSKKTLSKLYPISKEVLFRFTAEHPDVLQRYKRDAAERDKPPTDADIDSLQP